MSFPRYPAYRPSGVEWLGEVPEHWRALRLRFAAQVNPSKQEAKELGDQEMVSFLPMEAIGEDGSIRLEQEKEVGECLSGYTYFRDGDVCVAKITPCFENGKGAILRELKGGIGFGTTELIVARPNKEKITSKFLDYLFRSQTFRRLGESEMYGAGGQKRVPDSFVRDFASALPSIEEQSQVTSFLDRETTKIDALIAEQQRLIELLQEKRKGVISHAVTKGLNPNAPMKDSGVEWLGEVPEHWEVKKIKHVGTIRYGIGEPPEYKEQGVPLIRATNVCSGEISQENMAYVNPVDIPAKRILWLKEGDIIVVRSGALTGDSAIVKSEHAGSIAGFDMVLTCTEIMPLFAQYCLLSPELKAAQIDITKQRAAQPHLNSEQLSQCLIAAPPSNEQQEICDYLDRELHDCKSLVDKSLSMTELLRERRSALISAAVTGQIDVRRLVQEEGP